MKGTLEFSEEETEVLRMSINGPEAHFAIRAIKEQCRQFIKYDELTEKEVNRLDQIGDLCHGFDID